MPKTFGRLLRSFGEVGSPAFLHRPMFFAVEQVYTVLFKYYVHCGQCFAGYQLAKYPDRTEWSAPMLAQRSTSTKSTQTTLGTSPCTTYKIGYVTISQEIAGGLLMPGEFPTSEEVKRKTQKYTRKLFRDWVTLSAIAKRHEMLTMNTWARKSFSQRTKILLPAWPNMATQHRPDIAAFQNNSSTQSSREAYMWSYIIDLEDLPKPEKFLIFVDVRGLNQPERFVHSDLEMAQLSESSRVAMPSFLNRYTMLFLGRNNVRNCGELWPWSEDQGAFENIRNGIGIHPGHGFQA